ncbi:hypothetical protein [Candidatus Bealeia paramacronuclearis]
MLNFPLSSAILPKGPEGCPSIGTINAHYHDILQGENNVLTLENKEYKLTLLKRSEPIPSFELYTKAVTHPDSIPGKTCDYDARFPDGDFITHHFRLEPVTP